MPATTGNVPATVTCRFGGGTLALASSDWNGASVTVTVIFKQVTF